MPTTIGPVISFTTTAAGLAIYVGGVNEIDHISEASLELNSGERSRARLVCEGILPALDNEVIVNSRDGMTAIFGGLVISRRVVGVAENSLDDIVEVHCADWSIYAEWCSVSLSYAADVAPETVLADIVAQALGAYGITYTPVATGLLLAPFTWDDMLVAEGFRTIRARTGRAVRFRPNKSLVLEAPGSVVAPIAITDSTVNRLARFAWSDNHRARANSVRFRFGPTGTGLATQRWVADGVATSWVTDIPAADPPPVLVMVDDGVAPYLTTVGAGGAFEWDRATHTLSLGTNPLPVAGTHLVLGPSAAAGDPFETEGFTALYPFTVVRPVIAPALKREHREHYTDVTEYGPAVEIAEQALARLDQNDSRELDILTDEDGFDADQALTVNTTKRGGIVGTFLVGTVFIELINREHWEYSFTATEGSEQQTSFQDEWRQLTGGGGSAGSVVLGGGTTGTALSSPAHLGGTDIAAIEAAEAAGWTRVKNAPSAFVAPGSFTGRVRVDLWAREAGAGVTARLLNVTDGTAVESSQVVSQTATPISFVVAILSGKTYQMQVKRTSGVGDVYANGATLEAA